MANSRYGNLVEETNASAIITSKDVGSLAQADNQDRSILACLYQGSSHICPSQARHPVGFHPRALIGSNVSLGKDAALGAYAVIDDNAAIGDRTVIYPGCFIGSGSSVGNDCIIYPNVSIRRR